MSDLQRSFAKAKLAGLPLEPPLPANALREEREREDEALRDVVPLPDSAQDEDSSSASSASSTGTVKPNSKHFFARPDGFVHSPTLLRPISFPVLRLAITHCLLCPTFLAWVCSRINISDERI